MSKKQKQQLCTIVSRTLSRVRCKIHNLPITQLNLQSFKLGCKQCNTKKFHNCPFNTCKCTSIAIQQIVRNPIQAAVTYRKQTNQQISNLRQALTNIEQYKNIKIGFQAIINDIKQTITKYCNNILQQFNNKWNIVFEDSQQILQQIKLAQNRYCRVFQELIQSKFQQGYVQEFQQLMEEFCGQCSQDPYEYLKNRVDKVMKNTQNMPNINWQNVKQLHSTITDPSIWQITKLIKLSYSQSKSCRNQYETIIKDSKLLLPQLSNCLSNSNYSLIFTKQNIQLYKKLLQQPISTDQSYQNQPQQNLQPINQLPQQNDAYYQIDRNRIIGINYRGLTLYRYGIGGLQKYKKYPIPGCQTILSYNNCLILQAENRIIRLWLYDGFKQVVGLSGNNLQYGNNQFQFCYTNGKGQNVIRSAFHNVL